MTNLFHRNQATITAWEARWQSGPPDDDDRDDDEVEEDERDACRREEYLTEMARERREENRGKE
jgi:hypothetical protein